MGVGTDLVEMDVGDKVGCKGTGEKDQLGVVEDDGNCGGVGVREFGRWRGMGVREQRSGSGFVGDI